MRSSGGPDFCPGICDSSAEAHGGVLGQAHVAAVVLDEAGCDAVDVDAAPAELAGKVRGEAVEGVLGDAVDAASGERAG